MKRYLRHAFAFLLVLALLVPMAGAAWAVDAKKIELAVSTRGKLYFRESEEDGDRADDVTLTATITPEKYDGQIKWSVTDKIAFDADLPLDEALDNNATNRTLTLTLKKVTEEKSIGVTILAVGGDVMATQTFVIAPDKIQPFEVDLDDDTLEVGETTYADADPRYLSGDKAKFTYSSSDEDVAVIDPNTGKITAKAVGTTTITAETLHDSVKASTTLTVAPANFVYTAVVGQQMKMDRLRDDLVRNYRDIEFYKDDLVAFLGIRDDTNGALFYKGGQLENGDSVKWSQLGDVYFVAEKDKDFTFTARVKHDDDFYIAQVTIKSSLAVININVPIGDTDMYSFSEKAATGKAGYRIILDAYSDFEDFETDGSFVFDKVSRSSRNIGTLTTTGDEADDISYVKTVNAANFKDLVFLPSRTSGTYEVDYAAYSKANGRGTMIASGTLSITVNAETLDLTVSLDSDDPYLFSSQDGADPDSARNVLVTAINKAIGKDAWDAITFDTDHVSRESYAVGTLYKDNTSTKSANELASDDYVSKADLGKLYFVPEDAGDYVVSFAVYGSEYESALASGTLTINVASDLAKANFLYVVDQGGSITLNEDDFAVFVQDQLGIRYSLACITLDSATSGGTFYNAGKKFTPNGTPEFYSEEYEDAPKKASYISDVSFTAPNKAGITTVHFTATAVRGNTGSTELKGVFYIFYGATDVPVISYNVSTGSTLNATFMEESDFVEVYKSVTGSTAAKPQFNITFHTLPPKGLIYRNYDYLRGTGKALSASDIDTSFFTVNSSVDTYSVSILSYVPDPTMKTTESATYIAYDKNGVPVYIGTINFVVTAPVEKTVSAEGLDFSTLDFSIPGGEVTYVTFAAPSSGKIYVANGSQLIAVTSTTKLWISDPTAGSLSVSKAHYIPKEGSTEKVTLTYTAHLKSGASYEGRINVTPTSRTVSAKFSDVKGNTGKWAANSVDFASYYGLVKGVGDDKFDPEASMRRCDLIIIFYRMAGSPAVSGANPYTDAPTGTDSYSQEIYKSSLWAYQHDVLGGVVTGDKYEPKNAVTRQEYIRILYNFTKAMGVSVDKKTSLSSFTDAGEIADYAVEAMQWAVANNYMKGTGDNKLSPTTVTRRAEIVTFLHRYYTY